MVPVEEKTGDDMIQRVIDAAATCVERIGLDATTVDDIAREAGVSRATLYRRFGNRDEILAELLRQQARPYVDRSGAEAYQPTSLAQRIEIGTLHVVMEMPRNRWLKAMFDSGIRRSNFALIQSVYQQFAKVTLWPALEAARVSGELRSGLEVPEISDWLLREYILLVSDGPWEEPALRRRIQRFILPVLIADRAGASEPGIAAAEESPDQRLTRLENRMVEMQQMLGVIRSELHTHNRGN
jgi:AcrR family transcriptional regulator